MFNNAEVGRAFHVHLIQSPKMETALQQLGRELMHISFC